ncbi:MAG: hypothetical protein IIC50_04090 [Planctomycetes bacterium]|nr:hypothetical protein [Planctomycetota bacterium]
MSKKNVTLVSSIAAVIILISVVSAITLRGDKGPDFTGKSPEEIKAYFNTEAFARLSEKDQRAVKKRAFGSFKGQEQQKFVDQAKTYAKLPPKQKIRFLDEMIGKYVRGAEQKRKNSGVASRSGSGAKGGSVKKTKARGSGKPSASEGYRAATEKMDPLSRAHVLELKEAITARMDERGVQWGK